MDAIRWLSAAACLLFVSGCALLQPQSKPQTTQQKGASDQTQEPPQIVRAEPMHDPAAAAEATPGPDLSGIGAAGATGGEDVTSAVLQYIKHVDTARARPPRTKNALLGEHPARERPYVADDDAEEAPLVAVEPAHEAPAAAASAAPPAKPTLPGAAPRLVNAEVYAQPVLAADMTRVVNNTEQPPSTAVNTSVRAQNTAPSLAEILRLASQEQDPSFREQLDQRLLAVLAGEYRQARLPLTLVTAQQQSLAAAFVESLIAIREGQVGGDAGTGGREQLGDLQRALHALADLSLPTVKICRAVTGFGQYELMEPARVRAGDEFVLYCEVRDFVSESRADGFYYTTFDMTTTLLTPTGEKILTVSDQDITDRCRNRRQDCFIPRLLRVPAETAPGNYVVKATLVDKLGQKVAENQTRLEVVARP